MKRKKLVSILCSLLLILCLGSMVLAQPNTADDDGCAHKYEVIPTGWGSVLMVCVYCGHICGNPYTSP